MSVLGYKRNILYGKNLMKFFELSDEQFSEYEYSYCYQARNFHVLKNFHLKCSK